jgi:hypothetical protein
MLHRNKYIETLIQLTELPAQNEKVHDGFCKITTFMRNTNRPCNYTDIDCCRCIFGRPTVNEEIIKIREHVN